MRWRKVYPGRKDQVRLVRRFVAGLLADRPDCDDIVLCASELAANAIRHTASGRGGFFAVEVIWAGAIVRLAVADGGAPTGPIPRQLSPGALNEAGRGLSLVAKLSASYGTEGDHRGRVVWAQFRSTAKTAASAACLPLSPQPGIEEDTAMLAQRYARWHTWFGHWTRQWWALPKNQSGPAVLIAEPTAEALASHLDAIQGYSLFT